MEIYDVNESGFWGVCAMKKVVFLILIISMPVGIFAKDFSLSAGAGGLAGYTFTRYTLEGSGTKSAQSMDRINYAGFLFFDATYVELSIMFQGNINTYSENMIYDDASLADSSGVGYETSLGFSLMGKYPLKINEKMTWFPLLGAEYQITLLQRRRPDGGYVYDRTSGDYATDRDKDDNPYPLYAWNALWVNIGAGLDFYITGSLFLRGELFFGFRMPTIYELGALEVVKNPPMNVTDPSFGGLTGSPTLKIAVGYRFWNRR